jgi:MtrB/PioB family decaheme-associated outer membrane protein
MTNRRLSPVLRAACRLALVGPPVIALLGIPRVATADDPFAGLAEESRPPSTRRQLDTRNQAEVGVGYVSEDNFMFGQYNGLNEDGAVFIGTLDWRSSSDGEYWELSGTDLGLDTRSAGLRWGNDDGFELKLNYDGQQQVKNNTGRTPYSGSSNLTLPDDWVPSNVTSGFATLDGSSYELDQKLERDIYSLDLATRLTQNWNLEFGIRYEEKEGTLDTGAAFFIDASAGHSAIIPQNVDYSTSEFDFALNYEGEKLQLTGSWFYSDFDNNDDLQLWQNPYNAFYGSVNYPEGQGGIGVAPDNEQNRARLMGVYTFNNKLRLQVDGSYSRTEQDQNFADYTVNPNLRIDEPLPADSLDGQVDSGVLDARLFYRPLPKLNLELRFHGEERDYDGDRNGYRYVMGDAANQSRSALTVYNSYHDLSKNLVGLEGSYRLPWNSKLWLDYAYEEVDRDNAAVEKTEEDLYRLRYRIRAIPSLTARLEVAYAERRADTYNWNQSYYSLLDSELINNTPDAQRYITHPQLSQNHLASRDRTESKLDLTWQPGSAWNLALNLLWREDDYSETELGLTDEELGRVAFNASWVPHSRLILSAWASYDQYETEQTGRNFRGGLEKNAFEIYGPLPQASDPARDWDAKGEDDVTSLGLNADWQAQDNLHISADYSYVETTGSYDFTTYGAGDIDAEPLPDNETHQHHVLVEGAWSWRENIDIKLNYQYWKYEQDDWAIHNVAPDTIDKVLTLGEQEADEDLHYIGASVIYRWQ